MEVTLKSTTNTKMSLMSSLMEADSVTLTRSSSFKEDSYLSSTLKSIKQKSLKNLKNLLFSTPISMWGVNLSTARVDDDRADVILLKFLSAHDFNVAHTYSMLLKCVELRENFGVNAMVDEELGFKELKTVIALMQGWDRDGHSICYNAYGIFKEKELYKMVSVVIGGNYNSDRWIF